MSLLAVLVAKFRIEYKNLTCLIRVFSLIMFLSLHSLYSNGQNIETYEKLKNYEKGANYIIVATSDSTNLAFKKIASLVMDYGFTIDNSDKDLFYLNTPFETIGNWSFKTKLNVRVKMENNLTKVILKGEVLSGQFKFKPENLQRKGQVTGVAFAQMFEIAEQYDNGTISVLKD